MHRAALRGYSPTRWPWRYWLIVVLILVAGGLLSRPLFPAPPVYTRPPPTEDALDSDLSSSPSIPVALAQLSLNALLARQSRTLDQAVARYSLKAGRPPPPNFDRWFEFAREHECLIDDYDQIQRDFEPFYQLARDNPGHFQRMIDRGREQMLREAMGLPVKKQEAIGLTTISITDGKFMMAPYRGTVFSNLDLPRTLRKFAHFLPDMEFLLNGRDEPRVIFNYRELGAREKAVNLLDPTPFHIAPHPTSDFFKDRSGCSPSGTLKGFATDGSADIASPAPTSPRTSGPF
ncbi:hypothetical protein FB451DRAFT_558133 [Mycena latifolia]|nr:hypothetical protein FB451DRAFT_558133 [Mycena latifolia]